MTNRTQAPSVLRVQQTPTAPVAAAAVWGDEGGQSMEGTEGGTEGSALPNHKGKWEPHAPLRSCLLHLGHPRPCGVHTMTSSSPFTDGKQTGGSKGGLPQTAHRERAGGDGGRCNSICSGPFRHHWTRWVTCTDPQILCAQFQVTEQLTQRPGPSPVPGPTQN